jgi:hypothetical protein
MEENFSEELRLKCMFWQGDFRSIDRTMLIKKIRSKEKE